MQYGSLRRFQDSQIVGELYGQILVKKYSTLNTDSEFSVSLDDLLSWPYWCDFIRIYSMSKPYNLLVYVYECSIM